MPRRAVAGLCLALLLGGCGRRHVIDLAAPGKNAERLGRISSRHQGTIELADGRKVLATEIRVTRGVVFYDDEATGRNVVVPASEVRQIEFRRRARSTLLGLGLGVAGGFALGAGLGVSIDVGEDCSVLCPDAGERALIVGALFGTIGLLLGPPIGAAAGGRTRFVLRGSAEALPVPSD